MSLTDNNHEQYWHQQFAELAEDYENGNIGAADVWAKFKFQIDFLESQINIRKAWGNEKRHEIISEFEKYGKDGYKGITTSDHKIVRYSYDHIPEWKAHKETLLSIENDAKNAVKLVGSGGEIADTDTGQVVKAAIVSESFSLKTTTIKQKK